MGLVLTLWKYRLLELGGANSLDRCFSRALTSLLVGCGRVHRGQALSGKGGGSRDQFFLPLSSDTREILESGTTCQLTELESRCFDLR